MFIYMSLLCVYQASSQVVGTLASAKTNRMQSAVGSVLADWMRRPLKELGAMRPSDKNSEHGDAARQAGRYTERDGRSLRCTISVNIWTSSVHGNVPRSARRYSERDGWSLLCTVGADKCGPPTSDSNRKVPSRFGSRRLPDRRLMNGVP